MRPLSAATCGPPQAIRSLSAASLTHQALACRLAHSLSVTGPLSTILQPSQGLVGFRASRILDSSVILPSPESSAAGAPAPAAPLAPRPQGRHGLYGRHHSLKAPLSEGVRPLRRPQPDHVNLRDDAPRLVAPSSPRNNVKGERSQRNRVSGLTGKPWERLGHGVHGATWRPEARPCERLEAP